MSEAPAPASVLVPTAVERARRLRAIGLMMLAVTCFSGLDSAAKWLVTVGGFDPWHMVFARYASNMVLLLIVVNPLTTPGLFRTAKPGLQIVRALFLLLSTALNFLALQYLQLADAVSIMFSMPFWSALIAGIVLGRWIGPLRWGAIALGFLGVLIVTRPGLGGMHWAAIYSVVGAIVYAIYGLLTREVTRTDSDRTIMFYGAAVPTVVLAPIILPVWQSPAELWVWLVIGATGFFGLIGHMFLIMAHRDVPAQELGPFVYVQLISMAALGWIIFGDVPGPYTIVGAGVIVASGLWLIALERRGTP